MTLSWELPHTNCTPLKLFSKAKGLPKSGQLFRQPFDRKKPILLIYTGASHTISAVRCDKDAGRDCGSDDA